MPLAEPFMLARPRGGTHVEGSRRSFRTARRALLATAATVVILFPGRVSGQSADVNGLASLAGSGSFNSTFDPYLSLRVIPAVDFSLTSGRRLNVDGEVSVNAIGTVEFPSGESAQISASVAAYRAWLRFAAPRVEARVGLQEISFGSATLFRPLMWFDSLDPRDPLQLTEGVYALLLRYYTKGNAAFSAWVMYGNDAQRGWDIAPPDADSPEFGGRVQVPLFKGELGAAYHHRRADLSALAPPEQPAVPAPAEPAPEDRFGFDGKWDVGVGLWVEAAIVHQDAPLLPTPYQRAFTVGVDYTFGLGNGLTALAEHFRLDSSAEAFSGGDAQNFSALFLRYPLGVLDELTGIVYYDWKRGDFSRFVTWKRTYDSLAFNVILFNNPEQVMVFPGQVSSSSFAGTGLQVLLSYNF
jgi:hypothetical protein